MPLVLTRRDVERVLTMKEAIDAVEEGFRQLALGTVVMPQRPVIRVEEHHGLHLAMPAFIGGERETLALKVVTVYPDNPSRHQLPTTIGTLLLNDPRTGALQAIMDAGFLTAMRTGAVSGVATKHLAPASARTVAVFGAGAMARTQLIAVKEVRPLTRAVVFDPARELSEKFAAEMSQRLSLDVSATDDVGACLECDILCLASSSRTPLFDGSRLRPGTHLNGIGSHSPDARELDTETIRRSKVVVDHRPACLAEAGDLMLPIKEGAFSEEKIHASLGEIVAGMKPGREAPQEITLFKSVGLAVQDAATAALVFRKARAAGVGIEIEI
jgi:ornithine cyclodeaminase/alanine dehydrogenase